MALNFSRARPLLQSGDLATLFREELGWEPSRKKLTLRIADQDHALAGFAEKRGFTAWLCLTPDGRIPDHVTRLKLERKLTETSFEHLIVYTTLDRARQSWMWVRRETAKPLAVRTHEFIRGQPGDSLLQKLSALYISFEEEEAGIATIQMSGKARTAFDLERVTKVFYRDFDTHRKAFLKFITGIGEIGDREWYASVMLNRMMFVYFIQKKGFLDGDRDYLRHRLRLSQQEKGKDKFYSFYRYFLLRLFHEGFGKRRKDRAPDLEKLLGNIPYLNGGLFDVHELEKPERYGADIEIPDSAFKRVFDFFDTWQWHLDERPLRKDDEINPDVLGYIFEKYINQKQMGAYYTKEDITDYIGKNTILPFLFDAVRTRCKVAFENPGGPTIWGLLRENPDRYIYPAVRHSLTWYYLPGHPAQGEPLAKPLALPPEIAVGLDVTRPDLIVRRKAWNKPAPNNYALPTEIWREVVARRQHYEEVRRKLVGGEVRDINDFTTLNLDLRQFAQDVIQGCEGPDLLMALWHAITTITVLDPTGGSGAFVFASLNILDPLYEACLDRMEAFLAEWGEAGRKAHPNYHKKFSEVLGRVESHLNRRYFVLKSIILNNLYAVDIMEEAVEICKLRLFLKLAAQVEPDAAKDNLGIEPLPDVDFNIRAGNTLVGYATADEVSQSMTTEKTKGADQLKLMGEDELSGFERFNTRCADVEQAFAKFRQLQTEGDGSVPSTHKQELQKRLKVLEDELNRHLAVEYGVKVSDKTAYVKWVKSHQPFHWFIQFYGILGCGGFDVIVGNPPYIELKEVTDYAFKGFRCEDAGNLYAVVLERCAALGRSNGRQGFIVPVSSVSTDRYDSLQGLLSKREDWFSSFDDRPSRLFDGLEHIRLTIHIIGRPAVRSSLFSTCYNKWSAEERETLFANLRFARSTQALVKRTFPKLTSPVESSILAKLAAQNAPLCRFFSDAGRHSIYYSRKVGYFLQVLDFEPRVLDGHGRRRAPSEFKTLSFATDEHAQLALSCLNSNLFYWFITVFSDCRHVNKREIEAFPIDLDILSKAHAPGKLANQLMQDLKRHSVERVMRFKHDTLTVQCIYPKESKPIIDEIDTVLAAHYGFTLEELDFIQNYDVKYRLGQRGEEE